MKKLSFIGFLAWLLATSGCSTLPININGMMGTPKQFESRQIIVTLSEELRSQWRTIHQDILDHYDVQAAGEFPLKSIRVNCLVYSVSEMVEVDEVMRRLSTDNRIELVQLNQVFDGLQGVKSNAYKDLSYGPKMIHADLAHNISTGKGVTIAVIDTGVDENHPDLKGHVASTQNFVEGGTNTFAEDKHGTAVAGVIGARNDNGIGIDGIAPDAKIDVYKACWYPSSDNGKALCSSWTLAKAIDAAIANGNRIINLSLSGPEDPLLKKLLVSADQHHIVLVAAALEKHSEPGFPASLSFVIPVISANPNGDIAKPRWKTSQQVIAAPGVEILTTAPGNSYDFLSGSSLAAAYVSGVVALMLQQQPTLKPEAIRTVLKQSSRPNDPNQPQNDQPLILLDACRALAALGVAFVCP